MRISRTVYAEESAVDSAALTGAVDRLSWNDLQAMASCQKVWQECLCKLLPSQPSLLYFGSIILSRDTNCSHNSSINSENTHDRTNLHSLCPHPLSHLLFSSRNPQPYRDSQILSQLSRRMGLLDPFSWFHLDSVVGDGSFVNWKGVTDSPCASTLGILPAFVLFLFYYSSPNDEQFDQRRHGR